MPATTPSFEHGPEPRSKRPSRTLVLDLPGREAEQRLLDELEELQVRESLIEARRAETIERLRTLTVARVAERERSRPGGGWDAAFTAHRELATELAPPLRESEHAVETRIAHAQMLAVGFAETADTLSRGVITARHAQILLDQAACLPAEARAEFERVALPAAERLSVPSFSRRARRLRELLHTQPLEERAVSAAQERYVRLEPARDAMAYLTAYLPAVEAHAAYNRLTGLARAAASETETRTLPQRRADAFRDLLIDGDSDSTARGIRATVLVTVPVQTLIARATTPAGKPLDLPGDVPAAHLEGYGPIDDEAAARLAARAPSFRRILTHPHTGAVLSVGRGSYTVPADLAAALRVRDETCRFPGCLRSAAHAEIDHTRDWAHGGETDVGNLAHLCVSHHQLKHRTAWTVDQVGGGTLRWTSPLGRHHETEPDFTFAQQPRVRTTPGHADSQGATPHIANPRHAKPQRAMPVRDDGSEPPPRIRIALPTPDRCPF